MELVAGIRGRHSPNHMFPPRNSRIRSQCDLMIEIEFNSLVFICAAR